MIDTSGPVSDAELGTALLEVTAIGRAVGGRRDQVSGISCDAATGLALPLCRAEGVELVGGGRDGSAVGVRAGRTDPSGCDRGVDGRADAVAGASAVPDGGGLFRRPRGGRVGEDPVAAPPEWARVVVIR
ncbi:hypothetical protein GCM10020256_35840 [Streptomyces thermocoprophilus]